MSLRIQRPVAAFALLLLLAAGAPPTNPPGTLVPSGATAEAGPTSPAQALDAVEIPETGLAVDLPSGWFPGGFSGLGVLLSYLGGGDGYPRFTAQHDPEASLPESATTADAEEAVEELFEEIAELLPDSEVVEAGWTEVNGIRVHRSTLLWESVAGAIRGSRLILVQDRRPLVLSWVDRERDFAEIAELVRASMNSVRRIRSAPVAARSAP